MARKPKEAQEAPKLRGRPSTYTPEIAAAVCARLALGETLRSICRDEDMPPESTVRLWALDDVQGFAAQYARARDLGLDAMAEQCIEIADEAETTQKVGRDGETMEVVFDSTAVARNRLRLDARKWLLSKMAPKRYGDKLETVLSGGVTVRKAAADMTDDELAAIAAGGARNDA